VRRQHSTSTASCRWMIAVAVFAIGPASCSGFPPQAPDGVACTTQFVYGLVVTVKDTSTGQTVCDAAVTAISGSYRETLHAPVLILLVCGRRRAPGAVRPQRLQGRVRAGDVEQRSRRCERVSCRSDASDIGTQDVGPTAFSRVRFSPAFVLESTQKGAGDVSRCRSNRTRWPRRRDLSPAAFRRKTYARARATDIRCATD
jgi:hypothetical protein